MSLILSLKESLIMSVTGNIREVLKQIELLIKIYGDASLTDIQQSVYIVRNK